MDQVLSYLDDGLAPLKRESEEAVLTKTMINNYVKAGALKAPLKKKYDKHHLMALTMLYRLKSSLQVKDIKALLASDDEVVEGLYTTYLTAEASSNQRVNERLEELANEDVDTLIMNLAVEADVLMRVLAKVVDEKEARNEG